MRIVQERVDRENYLELCITPKELQQLKDYLILSRPFIIQGMVTNVGIKLSLDEDLHEEYGF